MSDQTKFDSEMHNRAQQELNEFVQNILTVPGTHAGILTATISGTDIEVIPIGISGNFSVSVYGQGNPILNALLIAEVTKRALVDLPVAAASVLRGALRAVLINSPQRTSEDEHEHRTH